ncbi:hypothetical protein GQR58_029807 [Nymphon striatum]|nr:hypothetical protein GQR58_029807 [Nymphon striatum]
MVGVTSRTLSAGPGQQCTRTDMTIDVPEGELYLGKDAAAEPTLYEAANLTTHGVIVGMTGSGKTGLGMVMLEEALLSDIPTLIIDPKGDMGNLLLTFPDLAASDFAPWLPDDGDAQATADLWRSGLERSGIDASRIGKLRSKCDMTIYTLAAPAEPELADNESSVPPPVSKGIDVRYLRNDAPWADDAGHRPDGTRLVPALAVRINLLYDETKADLRHEVEWEAVVRVDDSRIDPDDALTVDFDDRDFDRDAPADAVFVLPEAPIDSSPFFTKTKAAFKDHIYRSETLELFSNPELKAYSRVGETRVKHRCEDLADDRADEQVEKLRDALVSKEDRLANDLSKLEDRIRELEYEKETSRNNAIAGAAMDVLGGLLGGRRRSRSAGRSILRGRKATGKAEQRLATAENRYAEKMDDLNELRDEVEDDINQIVFEWQDKAQAIETYQVPLEKTDIAVDEISLVWIRE